jgi:hypothetical protein
MSYGADRTAGPLALGRDRRAQKPSYDPIAKRAKMLSDIVWEKAMKIAAVLAPEHPLDQEPLSDHESWMLLEAVAVGLSPSAWDDPQALTDLYQLRKMFLPGAADETLKIRAAQLKREQAALPDPTISPASPDFARRMERLKR